MIAPSDEEALAALATLRAWLGVGAAPSPAVYDQTHLPPGVSRDAFLRLHRARTRERVEGWSRRGKARLVTAEAWRVEIERDTSRARTSKTSFRAAPANVHDDLDRALGIRTSRGAKG